MRLGYGGAVPLSCVWTGLRKAISLSSCESDLAPQHFHKTASNFCFPQERGGKAWRGKARKHSWSCSMVRHDCAPAKAHTLVQLPATCKEKRSRTLCLCARAAPHARRGSLRAGTRSHPAGCGQKVGTEPNLHGKTAATRESLPQPTRCTRATCSARRVPGQHLTWLVLMFVLQLQCLPAASRAMARCAVCQTRCSPFKAKLFPSLCSPLRPLLCSLPRF